jgi:hypothetical protein
MTVWWRQIKLKACTFYHMSHCCTLSRDPHTTHIIFCCPSASSPANLACCTQRISAVSNAAALPAPPIHLIGPIGDQTPTNIVHNHTQIHAQALVLRYSALSPADTFEAATIYLTGATHEVTTSSISSK